MQQLGRYSRGENADTRLVVIARLDRATQYSETSVMESKSCGVLDTRLGGCDGLV